MTAKKSASTSPKSTKSTKSPKAAQADQAAPAPPSDAERNVGHEIAQVIAEPATTPEAVQEQAAAVDQARATGAVAAAERQAASPPAAPRAASSVTREPAGPADTEGAALNAVDFIRDDATRLTTELAEQELRAGQRRARGEGR
jgi:hypothetical protein